MAMKCNEVVSKKIFPLLSCQALYIDKLKQENGVLLGELQCFKQQLKQVVDENQALHDEIQMKVVSQTLHHSHSVLDKMSLPTDEQLQASNPPTPPTNMFCESPRKFNVWKEELQNFKSFYEAKEAFYGKQSNLTNKKMQSAVNEIEEIKINLIQKDITMQTSNTAHDGKLFQSSISSLPLIESLTREREGLINSLTSLRGALREAQSVEAELRQQVQCGLIALENIQLDKTKVLVERDQLKENYEKVKKTLQFEIKNGHKRVLDAASHQRAASSEELNNLQQKVRNLMILCTQHKESLTSYVKEKSSLLIQLEESHAQLIQSERDLATIRVEVQHDVKSTMQGYCEAERELRDSNSKLKRELTKAKQDYSTLEENSMKLHVRLKETESHRIHAQELNTKLTLQLNQVFGKLEQVKRENTEMKRSFTEELVGFKTWSSNRVEQLTSVLKHAEIDYEQRLSDVEGVSRKQHELINKMREECKSLEEILVHQQEKYRAEVGELTQKMELMKVKLKRLSSRNKELSKQCMQHGISHRKMQERLITVNSRARASTTQVLHLLDKQEREAIERKILTDDLEFLH